MPVAPALQKPQTEGLQYRPVTKGYKYRIYPTAEQIEHFNQLFGHNRFVWNTLLGRLIAEYKAYQAYKASGAPVEILPPKLSGYDLIARLPALKAEFPWLYDVSSVSLQQTALHLGHAFQAFFGQHGLKRKAGYPRFKKRLYSDSASLTRNGFAIMDDMLHIGNMGSLIPIGWSRNGRIRHLPSPPSSAIVSRTPTGKYYVSFICEVAPKLTSGTDCIGIDLGIKDLATIARNLSTQSIANPRHYKQYEANLARKQQKLSRCQKGSNRRNKARLLVAKIHEHIANTRKTYLHQLSRALVNDSQVIGLEMLRVANMARNRHLSKHIMDAGWSTFSQFIQYKAAESHHCRVVLMDTFYPSSHICSSCGLKRDKKLSLANRAWTCESCGATHHRDENAAKNMRARAIETVERFAPQWPDKPILVASLYT